MKKWIIKCIMIVVIIGRLELADAAEFEKLGSAIGNALGTKQVFQKKFKNSKGQDITAYYSKNGSGAADKIAFVEKGLYNPGSCTHTWVVGLSAATQVVNTIRVVELSCTHAHPTKSESYTSQYRGKGPADVRALKEKIHTIAKATGSCDLMTEAVQRSIENAVQAKTQL